MLTNNKVRGTNLGQKGSKLGFWDDIGVGYREEPKILGFLFGAARRRARASHGELPRTEPIILGVSGSWGSIWTFLNASFDVFNHCLYF